MDTHSSLVGSLYSRDGIPLQQFQDGHGRCFFSRSRAQEQRKDPVAQSLFREAGQPPWQWEPTTVDAVSTSCGCRVNEWFNCSTPLYPSQSVRKKGMPQKLGEKTPGSQGLGAGCKIWLISFLGTLDRSLVSGSKKNDGKAPSSPMWMLIHQKSTPVHRVSEKEGRPCWGGRWNGRMGLSLTWRIIPGIWINMDFIQTNYN